MVASLHDIVQDKRLVQSILPPGNESVHWVRAAASEGCTRAGTAWECCPRSALKGVLQQLESEFGISVMAGFETEFYLLREEQQEDDQKPNIFVPTDECLGYQTTGLDAMAEVLDEMARSLKAMGIPLAIMHTESGSGQFEITTKYTNALKAADDLTYTRETIACIAARRGLLASFVPKPFGMSLGSGCHCHLSLWKDGRNLMEDFRPPPCERTSPPPAESFTAGLLRHLEAVALWTLPSQLSHDRIQPETFSGAYRGWGMGNREAALRMCKVPSQAHVSNLEIRTIDNTMNPHLALSAIIIAGALGMRKGLELPTPCEDLYDLPMLGIEPLALHDMVALWQEDKEFQEEMTSRLSPALLQAYVSVRKHEQDLWHNKFGHIIEERQGDFPAWLLGRY